MNQKKIMMKQKQKKKADKKNKFINIPNLDFKINSKLVLLSKLVIGVLVFLQVVLPIVVIAWPNSVSHIIFQDFVKFPFRNLSNPEGFGLTNTFHFKLEHDGVSLGIWHSLPKDDKLVIQNNLDQHFKVNLGDKQNQIVVLYLHGNTNDRAAGHRVQLYKQFQSLGYHAISMDYRGYGDSSGTPTEDDVVKDVLFVYEYIRSFSNASFYVWGHSLGTGITAKMNSILSEKGNIPDGVILEAPFFNVFEEIELHPLAKMWFYNPLMINGLRRALDIVQLHFRSDIYVTRIKSKLLVLHAEDDGIVPFDQGFKLYEIAKNSGISKSVEFERFDRNLGCGHRNIWTAPNILDIIKKFII